MSRLWSRPRLLAYLGESHLAVSEVQGLLRPRIIRQAVLPAAGGLVPAAAALAEWRRAAAAPSGRLPLQVVLGSVHVRYVLLPWDPSLVAPDLREAVARALLQRQFQVDPAAFELRLGPVAWGEPQLAAFVARDLLATLADVATADGLRLRRVEPLLPVVLNRFARRLGDAQGEVTLVVAEAGRALCARLRRGRVRSLQLRPWRERSELERLLAQEGGRAFVLAPSQPAWAAAQPEVWLGLPPVAGLAAADADHVFALCGGL